MTKESGFVIINHVVKTTQKFYSFEPLAQAAEHLPFKQGVPGSIPGWLTKILFYTFKDTVIGVLETVNKIIYHTAEQVQLLHCDNIQFDTVALLLLTLTHPRRITAIQLRMVSALSSLADTADTMYPMPEIGCRRKVLLSQSWLFNLYCLWEMRQVGIYTADLRLVYQI